MNIEHCDCLSWFSRKRESHKQDGETLSAQRRCNAVSATGDPAMAFGPSSDRNRHQPVPRIGSSAAKSQLAALLPGKAAASCAPLTNARGFPRVNI
jgi:hypothetical protein